MENLIEEVQEVVEDLNPFDGKKMSADNKKKVMIVAGVGVGIVALILGRKKKQAGEVAYVAAGYDGYPTLNEDVTQFEEMDSMTSFYDSLLKEQEDHYLGLLEDTNAGWQDKFNSLENSYQQEYDNSNQNPSNVNQNLTYNETVLQMKANSDLWNSTSNADLRESLAEQNLNLGYTLGATRDNEGKWWAADGSRLYLTEYEAAGQNLASSNVTYNPNVDYNAVVHSMIAQGSYGDSAEVSAATVARAAKIADMNKEQQQKYISDYDKDVDYAAAIQTAKAQGASEATIQILVNQRQNKVHDQNAANVNYSQVKENVNKVLSEQATYVAPAPTIVHGVDKETGRSYTTEYYSTGGSYTEWH